MDTRRRAKYLLIELKAVQKAIKNDPKATNAVDTLRLIASTLESSETLAKLVLVNSKRKAA